MERKPETTTGKYHVCCCGSARCEEGEPPDCAEWLDHNKERSISPSQSCHCPAHAGEDCPLTTEQCQQRRTGCPCCGGPFENGCPAYPENPNDWAETQWTWTPENVDRWNSRTCKDR